MPGGSTTQLFVPGGSVGLNYGLAITDDGVLYGWGTITITK